MSTAADQLTRVRWQALDEVGRKRALARAPRAFDREHIDRVARIVEQIRADGDNSLRALTRRFDRCAIDNLRVDLDQYPDLDAASPIGQAVNTAKDAIERFHAAGQPQSYDVETVPGVRCAIKIRPIESVGLYIPAGSAPLISTALMLGIPARLAGCRRVVVATPATGNGRINGVIAGVLKLLGIDEVYRIGGAQAIAALAFGTESIAPVAKIFGPGNAYVTTAKQLVAQEPGGPAIDMPAGPSEVMVVADDSANSEFVAADLLSQAEHGADSQAILVTESPSLGDRVHAEIANQITRLPRAETAAAALGNSLIIDSSSREESLDIANRYAAEHLILQVNDAEAAVDGVLAAGSVFVGPYAPEALGDYCSGTNHVLPTCGAARAYSGVTVDSFVTRMMVQSVSREGLESLASTAETLASAEGLEAHRFAVACRRSQRP